MRGIVLNIPHAGTVIPRWAMGDFIVSNEELVNLAEFMCDKNVDKLWDFVPAEKKQVATVSRLVVDTERFRNDNEEAMFLKGMGLYYTHTPEGKQFRTRSQGTYDRCLEIYDAYHAALEAKVADCLEKENKCLILDCHSFHDAMDHTGHDPKFFPDVCIGVNGKITEQAQLIMDSFLSEGYSVKVNAPFSGSLIPLKFWQDDRVCSVMIELNRRIYDNANFSAVQALCRKTYEMLRVLL